MENFNVPPLICQKFPQNMVNMYATAAPSIIICLKHKYFSMQSIITLYVRMHTYDIYRIWWYPNKLLFDFVYNMEIWLYSSKAIEQNRLSIEFKCVYVFDQMACAWHTGFPAQNAWEIVALILYTRNSKFNGAWVIKLLGHMLLFYQVDATQFLLFHSIRLPWYINRSSPH